MDFARISSVCWVGALILLAGCGGPQKLSSAPEGITIFEDRNYRGRSLTLDRDQPDLEDIDGPCVKSDGSTPYTTYTYSWDNCISSIRVSPGWRGTVYGDDDYEGSWLNVATDIPDLRRVPGRCGEGMDDCISSIRVSRQP